MKTNKSSLLASLFIFAFLSIALIGAFIDESTYSKINVTNPMASISSDHFLGTDILGRDVLTRLLRGTYNTFFICISSVLIGGSIGSFFGLITARETPAISFITTAFSDIIFAFPVILLALILVSKNGASPIVATVSLSIYFIPVFYRIMYLTSRPIWQADYVTSAMLSKVSLLKISFRHVLPNARHILISQFVIQFANAIIAESALGYLGLSIAPPDPTLGSMLLDSQRVIFIKPFLTLPTTILIFLIILSLLIVGDNLGKKNDR